MTLEEKADIKALAEKLGTDIDDTADINGIAGLLARFWKKKELLGDKHTEVDIDRSAYAEKNRFDRNTASEELNDLILKKEEQKSVATV